MMKYKLILFLCLILNLSCAQTQTPSSKPITSVTTDELKNVVLLDVRTPEEYQQGHLENSLNVNWYDSDFVQQVEGIDKDDTIYVYCKLGGRSAKAQEKLKSLGYKNVVNLEGGYDAWSSKKQ
ncbi:rhodanese-like domain-containing protein [Maribacter litopenaei]|uniref:Rhodanese-like domain-containing protein n=1 Tax=Maribacter litopenaei TaxID=2976127 RepID=A0ABY5Y949_9FLAO|nr:rhodanese-like domain-containing protein [Maribacter litopenaei]UWX55570.1 rhodanese-like domain-containing protein [Maribacter litopenaei]